MISAVVQEYIPRDQLCRLEPGTLHLVCVAEPSLAVFVATRDLDVGDEVWIVPLDGLLVQYTAGIPVPGSATIPSAATTIIPPSQGGS